MTPKKTPSSSSTSSGVTSAVTVTTPKPAPGVPAPLVTDLVLALDRHEANGNSHTLSVLDAIQALRKYL